MEGRTEATSSRKFPDAVGDDNEEIAKEADGSADTARAATGVSEVTGRARESLGDAMGGTSADRKGVAAMDVGRAEKTASPNVARPSKTGDGPNESDESDSGIREREREGPVVKWRVWANGMPPSSGFGARLAVLAVEDLVGDDFVLREGCLSVVEVDASFGGGTEGVIPRVLVTPVGKAAVDAGAGVPSREIRSASFPLSFVLFCFVFSG